MYKEKKLIKSKMFILTVLFVVTMVITFISLNFELVHPATTTMKRALLPTVTMLTDNGTEYNRLHGYTVQIDESLLDETITPLNSDKKLNVVLNTYGSNIVEASYKVRNLSDMSLIENTQVTCSEPSDGKSMATLNIKNLISDNTEYSLEIVLKTDDYDEIHYYTRIITGDNYKLQDKIDFVKNFNSVTFDSSRLNEIAKYLETNSSGSNSNYGKVNINSSLSQVGWGNLNPFVESELVPDIKDINNEVAIICMNYNMGTKNSDDTFDSYSVSEYYRIRQTSSTMYLLNFEREADQIFDGKNDLTESSNISLGINSSTDVNMLSDSAGEYAYFTNNGTLWCFNADSTTFTKVFSFSGEESDNVRENYNKHDIKIMNVDDSGNCNFIVSGYMNRGEHEGEVGVSLLSYNYADNIVTERIYIPVNVPYEILSENVGGVAYLANDNEFYILIDDTLYSIDLVSKEVMTEVSGLENGTFAVSEDGKAIAYSTNGKLYETDTIRIFNMEKDNDYEIKAPEGDYIKALGYIKTDFIYGICHASDILIEDNGSETFPMYKICIMNTDYENIKEYEQEGVFVSAATVENMRINLTRIVRSADGGYEGTSIDQLINKDENNTGSTLTTDTYSSEGRKQELYIKPIKKASDNSAVTLKASEEVVFKDNARLELQDEFKGKGRYYVQGYGKFQGSYISITEAVNHADSTYGSVSDYNSNLIWEKYKSSSASISGISSGGCSSADSLKYAVNIVASHAGYQGSAIEEMNNGKNAVEVLNEIYGVNGINLKGVSVDKVLYYVGKGNPVIGRTGASSYAIIISYDSKNISYIDVASGASSTISIVEANRLFSQWENLFITYYKRS